MQTCWFFGGNKQRGKQRCCNMRRRCLDVVEIGWLISYCATCVYGIMRPKIKIV